MFNKKKQAPIRSLIAQGTVIQGNVSFSDGLRIDGEVHGNVIAASDRASLLVISETACVLGRVEADHVISNGRIVGPVLARTLLELQPKAHIEGDVQYQGLELHLGATIRGQLLPQVDTGTKPTLKLAANNA